MIVNQLIELSTKPKDQILNMIDSVQGILEHNQDLLVSNAKDRAGLILLYVHGKIEDILNE